MSTPGPFGGSPFEGMPIFGDLAKLFTAQGPVNWEVARQIGIWMATQGETEPNIDPLVRIRFEELARVAELHVADATGLSTSATGRSVTVRPVTRAEFATTTLEAYRPLFEQLAASLQRIGVAGVDDDESDASADDAAAAGMSELLGGLTQVMAPMMLGMQLGMMVGHLARRSLGQYDLPLPRPAIDELLALAANADEFAKDWSLPPDDVRLWLCLDVITHHAVMTRPHVRERLGELLSEYAGAFQPDPAGLEEKLGDVDPSDPESLQQLFGDPENFFGTIESDEQRRVKRDLEALTSVIEGYVDNVMDRVGTKLIGSYGPLTEALRRRRVERNDGDRFVERLFGLELGQKQYDKGAAFVDGLVERVGDEALARLWAGRRELPTPAEIEAPGLYWERINLPDD